MHAFMHIRACIRRCIKVDINACIQIFTIIAQFIIVINYNILHLAKRMGHFLDIKTQQSKL